MDDAHAFEPEGHFEPEDHYVIDTVEALKVLSDEKRLQILGLLTQQPMTVKEIAAELDLPANKLYYHMRQLEDQELIRVVATNVVSSIIEKTYRARAYRYTVSKGLLPVTPEFTEATSQLVIELLDSVRRDLLRALEAGQWNPSEDGHSPGEFRREELLLTPGQLREFRERLDALISDYPQVGYHSDQAPEPDPDADAYSLVAIMFPRLDGR
ncbi:MAG: helix-turn-helix transcriptional regulator [Chloroflexi bacterium]|nr:helix-turn-helix transcriptional regulator [Chloroflexota bacterium]